ncbi:MAG: hypothetical protein GY705_16575 [Bacteroidetes bacterium]|nr:hypothetical protein [Bacteroidota bacterium]
MRFSYWIILFFIPLFSSAISAQDSKESESSELESIGSFFQKVVAENCQKMVLETDFNLLISNKLIEHKQAAILRIIDNKGKETDLKLSLEVRGRNRRKTCQMPPLKLIFKKKHLDSLGLHRKFNKLKLVTHCSEDEGSEQILMREFWAYKLYNELTPSSFKVHLINIHYKDINNPENKEEHLAFLIEGNDELAARLDGKTNDKWGLCAEKVNKETYLNSILFQYMIGNTDWNLPSNRNLKFVYPDNGDLPMVVPYDFDFSGLVDAPYAIPNVDYHQKSIQQRIVMYKAKNKEDLKEAMDRFSKVREAQLQCFKDCKYLNTQSKNEMTKYLNSFYKMLRKPKKMEKAFLTRN